MIIPKASYGQHLNKLSTQLKNEWENLEKQLLEIALGAFAKTKRELLRSFTGMETFGQSKSVETEMMVKAASGSKGNE